MLRGRLTMLIGSTGPMLLTYTAVSITVGLTEKQQRDILYIIDLEVGVKLCLLKAWSELQK